jgi:hypothetical protein
MIQPTATAATLLILKEATIRHFGPGQYNNRQLITFTIRNQA